VIGDIASEIVGIGQAMLHSEATVEDAARMVYNTPTYSYGYQLAAADSLKRLDPAVLQAMLLPPRAHITRNR
jgi:hypothetical protein